MEKVSNEIVIEPRHGWGLIDWKELKEYRDLIYFLVWRDVKVVYKQTILGFGWAIIRPLFSMILFSVVFGRLAKVPSEGIPYPIFSYAGLIPWTYFSSALTASTQSLITQANVFTKVYFPRLFIPMTSVFSKLIDFGVAFGVLIIMMIYYGLAPTWKIFLLPYLMLLMILTAAGLGVWLSALAVQYRDVKHAMEFFTQILMFAAPVVWPASLIPQQYRLLYGLYPMAGIIDGFRSAFIGTKPVPWDLILMGSLSAVVIALTGAVYFKRTERFFADIA
jgi:lipopolysaccharide transport system permease protein